MEKLLLAFSLLTELEIESEGDDTKALRELLKILKESDDNVWTTRHGPRLLALLKIFGLIQPFEGQNRLDVLDPRLVCETLIAFEQFRRELFLKHGHATYRFISCIGASSNQKEDSFSEQRTRKN